MNPADKLLVKCEEEDDSHPHCPHGPMLLFYRSSAPDDAYFACSALRDSKTCGHRLKQNDLSEALKKKRYPVDTGGYKKLRQKINSVPDGCRNFCHTCNIPYIRQESDLHSAHQTLKGISDKMLLNPTSFLRPLENDKAEAQYFFDEESLTFFESCLELSNVKKVICIGTPSLHAYLQAWGASMTSFLLDFDHRYFYFYDDDQFAWYNMCNNHFFVDKQREVFEEFLRMGANERLAIFTDPPFGCRTEVVANSIKQITCLYRRINCNHETPAVFWVFPYFCEAYIRETAPEFEMCDYRINYTNHESYSNGVKGRKLGSPVRLFTNVPLSAVSISLKGYKHCSRCDRWTAENNVHCEVCGVCPSKNGDTYRHCPFCRMCVKPNYIHCRACRRCTQRDNHNCTEYQKRIRCWICTQVGHNEYNCQAVKSLPEAASPLCFLCRKPAPHNEKHCPQRRKFFHEDCFMGQRSLTLERMKRRNKK